MRRIIVLSIVFLIEAGLQPVRADMRATLFGALPVLPRASAQHETRAASEEAAPTAGIEFQPNDAPNASAMAPVRFLFDRHLGKAERDAELPQDLMDAIVRIEGIYDPTRIDMIDDAPRMEVRAGTAVMNNVFADRWRRDDTDPNVHIQVRYLAQGWIRAPDAGCDAFFKRRSPVQGFALSALSTDDCARLKRVRAMDDRRWTPATLAEARISVPIFAAPLPGARLSSSDFWAARRAKIAAINARLKDKWQITATGSAH